MKAIEFMVWLRDVAGVIRHTKEGNKLDKPSNGELRRWLNNSCIHVNGKALTVSDTVELPIDSLVLFPKSTKSKCTII